MAIIKGIIAIIFLLTLVVGIVFFVIRIEKIRKEHSFDKDEKYSTYCFVALGLLFLVLCLATAVSLMCL